jgi:hypothetical protein
VESTSLSVAYERDGFAVVRSVLDPAAVSLAKEHRERVAARLGLGSDAPIVAAMPEDSESDEVASDLRLVGLAATLLGPEPRCFGLSYLSKPAFSGLPTRWHQDAGPWAERLGGADALTVWIALTEADEDNGCLRVIPESHHLAAQPLLPDAGEQSLFGVGMDTALVDEDQARAIDLMAGDVVLLHQNLVHGADANHSARSREALSVRYFAPRTSVRTK